MHKKKKSPQCVVIVAIVLVFRSCGIQPSRCSLRRRSLTVLTGLKVATGTSTKRVIQLAMAPFQRPGSSCDLMVRAPLVFLLMNPVCGVDELAEVEITAAVVLGAADEVDGVEVGRGLEYFLLLRVVVVDLRRFDNLEASTVLGINGVEGTASGFAEVLHHAADAHGAVEELMEGFGIATFWYHDVKLFFCEADEAVKGAFVGLAVEGAEGLEAFLAEFEEHAGNHLLVNHCCVFHPVGHHIVNVFDEDEVGALLVEILYEGAVPTWAEDEAAILVACRVVLLVDGDGVCIMLLFREGYFEFDAECALVVVFHFSNLFKERLAVFG